MGQPQRVALRRLAERIEAIERRGRVGATDGNAFIDRAVAAYVPTGWGEIDAALGGGLAMGGLHEWLVAEGPPADMTPGGPHSQGGTGKRTRLPVGQADTDNPGAPGLSVPPGGWPTSSDVGETIRKRNPVPIPARREGGPPGRWNAPLCILVHLAGQVLQQDGGVSWTVWIGQCCHPYPRTLVRSVASGRHGGRPLHRRDAGATPHRLETGVTPHRLETGATPGWETVATPGRALQRGGDDEDRRLLEHSLFVSPRDAASRLWAVDLALRSPAVRVVVADGSGFDVAATRRIQVLARSEMKWALVARPFSRRNRLSIAQTRWLVRGHPSSGEDAGGPRWSVELLHGKGLRTNIERPAWVLEWNRGEGVVHLSAALADLAGAPQGRGADEERSSRSA